MQIEQLRQLSAWLAATDIGLLELRGPQLHLRLRHDGGEVRLESALPSAPSRAPARALTSTAPSVGVFLHTHPLRSTTLAPVGTRVQAGQPLGLMQIGALLLPVCAPQTARVTGVRVAHATAVGFGTPLFDLDPL